MVGAVVESWLAGEAAGAHAVILAKYTLTLAPVVEAGRPPTSTAWSLTLRDQASVLGHAICAGDPHGDHARVDGRAAARKHASILGRRIADADVRVVYARPPT